MPTPLFSPAQVREMDARAVDRGTTEAALMERAAGHLARAVVRAAGRGYGLPVTVLCGKGNNGGDGLALARRLRDAGAHPRVWIVEGADALTGLPAEQLVRWRHVGGQVTDGLQDALAGAEVAVDCLLGTGTTGEPRESYRTAIAALAEERAHGTSVIACDLPSGVDAATGQVPGAAVVADHTVTLGAEKIGLRLWPARGHCGTISVGDLDLVDPEDQPIGVSLEDGDADALLGAPAPEAHKRNRGTVLIVAGSTGMAGAGVLATRGALAGGAGLVVAAVGADARAALAVAAPEALTAPLPSPAPAPELAAHKATDWAQDAADELAARAADAHVVAIGPGLGRDPATLALVRALVARIDRPLVLDADALTAFAQDSDGGPALADHASPALVLTPHAGELARLTGGDARRDRVADHAREWNAIVVAKGPGTVTAGPDGRTFVNGSGTPALATGGTGDVLTGLLGAVLASSAAGPGFDGRPDRGRADVAPDHLAAVAAGVHWHGRAGELAARRGHAGAVTAGAVADALPDARAGLDPASVRTDHDAPVCTGHAPVRAGVGDRQARR